jgi:hypothetical protein
MAVYGAIIQDTDPFTSGFSVQIENDRDIDKYGYSNPFAVVAATMGVSLNVGQGTYTLPFATGSGCISMSDLHFLSPSTVYVAGTPYP